MRGHRRDLIVALLRMATAWWAAGRPRASSPTLGKFESWSIIIGGVLASAGVPGFLANLVDFYDASMSDESEWGAFLVALRELFRERSFTAEELRTMLEDRDATLLEASSTSGTGCVTDITRSWPAPSSGRGRR